MFLKLILSIFVFSFIILSAAAQDTLTFMYYNILNYSPAVPENTHNLKNITQYIKPDIFVLNEISNDTSATNILMYVLNIDSTCHYKKADFTDGPDTDNMLFYNSDKLSLYKQDTILTDLRIINEYLLYYNDSAYISQHDTVFLDIYSVHLKSNTGNEQQRLDEVIRFKNHLYENLSRKNIFFGGDMNFYNSLEPALTELLSPGLYQLNDPLDSIGDWHDNPLYSHIHTQSTRTRQFGGGADGGLDDRFDFIFVSNDIMNGTNQLKYIQGTHRALGNDGHHLNDSLTSLPLDPDIPENITYSLYDQSDHLPVIMKVYLNFDASLPRSLINDDSFQLYPNPSSGNIDFSIKLNNKTKAELELFTSTGQLKQIFLIEPGNAGQHIISVKNLENGVYIARLLTDKNVFSKKLIVVW